MKKRISMILVLLILCFSMAVPVFAAGGVEDTDGFADEYYRLQDIAGVLTEEEASEIQKLLDEISVRLKFDLVIATVDNRAVPFRITRMIGMITASSAMEAIKMALCC